ncbi:MAG TPA: sugar ABC transporter permease, partial [Armatimonadota bacterium]|nr:sugar ABC transporter permease [Armatimonadota bacterium]
FAFASPWFIGFLLFTGGPIVVSIVLSLCDYDVLHAPRYVGLDNYRALLSVERVEMPAEEGKPARTRLQANEPTFWKSLFNTTFMIIGVPISMAAGLAIAMLLNMKVGGLSVYRTIYYLPAVVPIVASSILWIWVLNPENGLLNNILRFFLPPSVAAPGWLTSDKLWTGSKMALVVMGLWGAGAGMIIWLAGLKGIPQHLYEAATIDGAGPWARFWHVTVPQLSPYIFFNLVMGIIGTFQIFDQAYVMTEGGPADSTLFYVYFLFKNAFQYFKMGMASAQAWILFVIVLILTLIQLKLAPRWVHYESE